MSGNKRAMWRVHHATARDAKWGTAIWGRDRWDHLKELAVWDDAPLPRFTYSINGGLSELRFSLPRRLGEIGETGDPTLDTDIGHGNLVEVHVVDADDADPVLVWRGRIEEYATRAEAKGERVDLLAMPFVNRLRDVFFVGPETFTDADPVAMLRWFIHNGHLPGFGWGHSSRNKRVDFALGDARKTSGSFLDDTVLQFGNYIGQAWGSYCCFVGLPIEQGATIHKAHIVLTASQGASGATCNATLDAEDADHGTPITSESDWDSRARTGASVAWSALAAWYADYEYQSPDIATVIQEVVDRAGWRPGNAINIFIDDDSSDAGARRYAYAYNSQPAKAPYLYVEWSTEVGALYSATFERQDMAQILDTIRELAGPDWYYVLRRDNTVLFKEKGATADHVLYLGRHVADVQYTKSTVNRKTRVIVYGDGVSATEQAAEHDPSDPRDLVVVDDRISIQTTANRKAASLLDFHNRVDFRAKVTVVDSNSPQAADLGIAGYDIESIEPGDTARIVNPENLGDVPEWGEAIWGEAFWNGTPAEMSKQVLLVTALRYDFDRAVLELSTRQPSQSLELEDLIDKVDKHLTAGVA